MVLDAVAYKKSQGHDPGQRRDAADSEEGRQIPGIVTADDMKGMVKAQGLAEIGAGDCVALHTGQGNTWSNDRYKSMTSEQRAAARAIFAQGEPGFGISACEYMASRNIALQMGDTSANDAQPFGEEGNGYAVPCHTAMQPRRGIWNLENVDTKSLVDAEGPRRRVHLGARCGSSAPPARPATRLFSTKKNG